MWTKRTIETSRHFAFWLGGDDECNHLSSLCPSCARLTYPTRVPGSHSKVAFGLNISTLALLWLSLSIISTPARLKTPRKTGASYTAVNQNRIKQRHFDTKHNNIRTVQPHKVAATPTTFPPHLLPSCHLDDRDANEGEEEETSTR